MNSEPYINNLIFLWFSFLYLFGSECPCLEPKGQYRFQGCLHHKAATCKMWRLVFNEDWWFSFYMYVLCMIPKFSVSGNIIYLWWISLFLASIVACLKLHLKIAFTKTLLTRSTSFSQCIFGQLSVVELIKLFQIWVQSLILKFFLVEACLKEYNYYRLVGLW